MRAVINTTLKGLEYIKGIRVSKASVRIYKKDDGQFTILLEFNSERFFYYMS